MPDTKSLFDQLHTLRATAEAAAQAQSVERQRIRDLERSAQELARRFDPRNPTDVRQREELTARLATSRTNLEKTRKQRATAAAGLESLRDRLAPVTDPREAIGTLDARYPVLLFPVRLETRFVTRDEPGGARKQLLVRVYPDDCLVDSFEPELSVAEVKNLRRYWCSVWNAGGDEGLLRAAWRDLCAAHGAGRALYLVRQYRPLAGSDPVPDRDDPKQIILVIPVDAVITVALEKSAVAAYWTALWRQSGGDPFDDLRNGVGEARAQEIRAAVVPFNHQQQPQEGVDRATAAVSVAFVVMTAAENAATKRQAWTRAPQATLLPERFVLIGESGPERLEVLGGLVQQPLTVGPDPLAEDAEQFARQDGDLRVPDSMKWMTDFDAGMQAGMAFRVDLTPRQAQQGFDRLYVLGVRLTSDPERARGELETLIRHQTHSQSGFAIVPQGAATNNTEQASAAWSRVQEADELFELSQSAQADVDTFDATATAPYDKADGFRLAEALGIDPAVLQHVPNADGTDQAEARAMNAALWPATLGYFMDTQLRPVFGDDVIERTRRHFIDRVSGRGILPAVRIGKQPYGILPTTAFSRSTFRDGFLGGLQQVLRNLESSFWNGFAANAPHVGRPTSDPQRQLLDILGLHASSVDFHLQVLDSADRIWNGFHFHARFIQNLEESMRTQMRGGRELLQSLGHAGADPEILEKFFWYTDGSMKRPVIDDAPLSETEELTECTPDAKNYLEWCRDKAQHAFDDLRRQIGFNNGRPNALLYHLLRHALQLGYHDVAVKLHVAAELIGQNEVAAVYREPSFVHVAAGGQGAASESRYRLLYASPSAITGDNSKTVAEFIPSWLGDQGRQSVLADQIEALQVLEHAPTARLERAFAEHLDLCSHRWDAWALSLVNARLEEARGPRGQRRQGLYLGAFGWVENLRPDGMVLSSVPLDGDLVPVFGDPDQPPLQRDPANGGHVLAPSLNHAVTAAVLRSGYLNNATPAEPDLLAVDLSSARVRVALQFIEGVRNGQPLGALLGYQLERRLHDRHADAEVDALIYQVRKAFPLAAKRISESTDAAAASAAIEAVEARNVCDGLLLLEHVRTSPTKTYPWDKALERGTSAQESVLDQEVTALFQIHDALADLAIAESVHQVTMGSADRAAAAMDAYAKAGFPPEPDVVRTPRSGTGLTHRLALHLSANAVAGAGATPRAAAEPAIDQWLGQLLPPMADLVVSVRYTNSTPGATEQVTDVSMQALGLSPVDVLHLLDPGSEASMSDLDDRVVRHVVTTKALCPDASVLIRYTEPLSGKKTVFESAPLIGSLRALLLQARPLKPSDAALQEEASGRVDAGGAVPLAPLNTALNTVTGLRGDVAALIASLAPLTDPSAVFQDVVDAFDAASTAFIAIQNRASLCGSALSGSGQLLRGAREWFALVRRKARTVATFWDGKRAEWTLRRAEGADVTRSLSVRLQALERAEHAVSTIYTVPLPSSPTIMLGIVDTKGASFLGVKGQIQAVAETASTTVAALWTAWSGTFIARTLHDISGIDVTEEEKKLRTLVTDMHQQLVGLRVELEQRLARASAAMTGAVAVRGEAQVQLLADAAKALLGDGFRILPRFTLPDRQNQEWQNAFAARAALVGHLAAAHEFPVDDWMYGVARVRPAMHHLEKVIQLTAAFQRPEPAIEPLQFPFVPGEPWLAMELPAGFDLASAGEHLLYSAIYATGGFDGAATAHVGLLLDEWTETVPGTEETGGLAFHYDRPSNEPPQVLLLVTPASLGAQWTWLDLKLAIPETFDLARKRAAEPRDLGATPLSRFLPATVMASTASPITIGSRLHTFDLMFANQTVNHE